ncbi:MAG: GNAT family N-acetyltransferase [Ilumatobacteraceae bacterium]
MLVLGAHHLDIVVDGLTSDDTVRFLEAHLEEMRAVSPPESKHALDLDGLRADGVTFWSAHDAREHGVLVACGALKVLEPGHGELKSMRVAPSRRGDGLGSTMLRHLLAEAATMGLARISLETGSSAFFAPARAMYARHGFVECPPFGAYEADPNSVFMTRASRVRHGSRI